jgi:hypothetical protein
MVFGLAAAAIGSAFSCGGTSSPSRVTDAGQNGGSAGSEGPAGGSGGRLGTGGLATGGTAGRADTGGASEMDGTDGGNSDDSAGGSSGTGGADENGGTIAAGGTSAVGGMSATTGGTTASGGNTSTGGAAGGTSAVGGTPSTGGTNNAGGAAGGAPATGGGTATGGTTSAGGATNAGGSNNTGGATSSGGIANTGGTNNTGGANNTGGTNNTGGVTNAGGSTSTGGATNLSWEFPADAQGWVGDFADYPPNIGTGYDLSYAWAELPAEVGPGGGLRLSGNNHSDDLFMYVMRQITGLAPQTKYLLDVMAVIDTNAPSDCGGIGGAPGLNVTLKIGAVTLKPTPRTDSQGYQWLNIDKGNQSTGGADMKVVGNLGNTKTCPDLTYEPKTFTLSGFSVTSASDGTLWLILGTDSGFEGVTTVYYDRIAITLQPSI